MGRSTLVGTLFAALAAGPAFAGTVVFPDGRTEKLAPGKDVTGPAVVATDDGKGEIRLRPGAILRYIGEETGKSGNRTESFFLKEGAAEADLGFLSRLATPAFWVFPETSDGRVSVFVAARGSDSAYVRTVRTEGMARLVIGQVGASPLEAQLTARQGISLVRGKNGLVRFRTDADNEWDDGLARLIYPTDEGTLLDLYIPKGTAGSVGPVTGEARRVRVDSALESWGSGSIRVLWTRDHDEPLSTVMIQPGCGMTLTPSGLGGAAVASGPGPSPPSVFAREESSRGLRRGSLHLDGRVEVVEMSADLVSGKPSLSFVLENVDEKAPKEPIGSLKYTVGFQRDGIAMDLGAAFKEPRPLSTPLGALGYRVTVAVEGLDPALDLAGAWPTLHLVR